MDTIKQYNLEYTKYRLFTKRSGKYRRHQSKTQCNPLCGWQKASIESHMATTKLKASLKAYRPRIWRLRVRWCKNTCQSGWIWDRAMWCHHPIFRDKNGEPLLLKRCGGREFWPKQNIYDDRVGVVRYFTKKKLKRTGKHMWCVDHKHLRDLDLAHCALHPHYFFVFYFLT